VIASALIFPLLSRISEAKAKRVDNRKENCSEDMVGTMALAYQNGYSGSMDRLNLALSSISTVIKNYAKAPGTLTEEEYRGIVIGVAERYCIGCDGSNLCIKEGIRPCIKNAGSISNQLLSGKRISAENINTDTEFCAMAGIIADNINREAARAERENYIAEGDIGSAEEYELISRLINDAKENDTSETTVDTDLTPRLSEVIADNELTGTVRVFGKRKKHLILACEDENGAKITSKKLRRDIEEAVGVKLGAPEYFRKDKMVLMECTAERKLAVSVATAVAAGSKSEISGDTVIHFDTDIDYYYAIISDGMGSGEVAKETSLFVSDFLRNALKIGTAKEALLHMLNHTVKSRKEECSATVDLLEIDLLSGGGTFIKSGAAPSFVKRGSSIFRIRSQTAPIGLLSSIDTEKIKVDIRPGDYVIMISDGVADEADDAPWLLLLLGEEPKGNLQDYANFILTEAIKNTLNTDDMTVAVIKIDEM
jgi:stage II sporulation protein E